MKDTWDEIFDSKSFILSFLASLATVLLISFYELIKIIVPENHKLWFKATFSLITISLIGWLFKRYNRLKKVEFEIERTKRD